MKLIIALLLITSNTYAISLDKPSAAAMNELTKTYQVKRKSTSPNKVAVFISYKTNPNYMDVAETTLDVTETSSNHVFFDRPNASSKKRQIDSCKSEWGVTVIPGNTRIQVNTIKFPSRVICYGDSGNYREAYITFKAD
jgi:hypothetical protein